MRGALVAGIELSTGTWNLDGLRDWEALDTCRAKKAGGEPERGEKDLN